MKHAPIPISVVNGVAGIVKGPLSKWTYHEADYGILKGLGWWEADRMLFNRHKPKYPHCKQGFETAVWKAFDANTVITAHDCGMTQRVNSILPMNVFLVIIQSISPMIEVRYVENLYLPECNSCGIELGIINGS